MQTAQIWWAEQIRPCAVSVTRRFARLSPERHQPRYQDSEPCSRSWYGQGATGQPQIAGAAIDHSGLGPSQGMRAEQARIKTDAVYPVGNKTRILPGREAPVCLTLRGK